MIILVEINVKGFLWKCAKKISIYGQNLKKDMNTFSKRKTLVCNLMSDEIQHQILAKKSFSPHIIPITKELEESLAFSQINSGMLVNCHCLIFCFLEECQSLRFGQ